MRSALALALLGVMFAGTSSAATTVSGTLTVKANVAQTCVVTGNTLDFGAYDPTSASPVTGSATVSVRCTKNTVAAVALNQGAFATGTSSCASPARQMANGAERLGYALYSNAGLTLAWGCDAPTNDVDFTSTSTVTPNVMTVYGRIPAGQDVGFGNYQDTVSVDVTF
jgi:spore coat protein U-like protein